MPEPRCIGFALAATVLFVTAASSAEPSPERQQSLRHLLRHDCGACHGMRLTGGLGPALTPAALHGKSAVSLTATVLHGRPGTPMPPWQGQLTETEARWLVKLLTEGQSR